MMEQKEKEAHDQAQDEMYDDDDMESGPMHISELEVGRACVTVHVCGVYMPFVHAETILLSRVMGGQCLAGERRGEGSWQERLPRIIGSRQIDFFTGYICVFKCSRSHEGVPFICLFRQKTMSMPT